MKAATIPSRPSDWSAPRFARPAGDRACQGFWRRPAWITSTPTAQFTATRPAPPAGTTSPSTGMPTPGAFAERRRSSSPIRMKPARRSMSSSGLRTDHAGHPHGGRVWTVTRPTWVNYLQWMGELPRTVAQAPGRFLCCCSWSVLVHRSGG